MSQYVKLSRTLAFEIQLRYRDEPALHMHNMHEFFLCLDGAGFQYTAKGRHKINKGELFFFPAGAEHMGSGTSDENCLAAVLNFGDNLFYRKIKEDDEAAIILDLLCRRTLQTGHKIDIAEETSKSVRQIMKAMIQEVARKNSGYQCAVKMYIQQLLITLLRKTNLLAGSRKTFQSDLSAERIAMAKILIDKHFNQHITVDFLCEKINMSRSYFHAAFLKHTGFTMTQYLNSLRLNAAIKMLSEEKCSTKEVAFNCGFGSVSNFYRTLRLETGLTPESLRNSG